MTPARFGWQGFELLHAPELSPVVLNGSRARGYVRFDAPGSQLQLKWETLSRRSIDRSAALEAYLARLTKATPGRKLRIEPDGKALSYRAGELSGAIFDQGCRRMILEATGNHARAHFERASKSLTFHEEAHVWPWRLYGLELLIPAELELATTELLSGKTALTFRGRGVEVTAERWALGRELLKGRALSEWVAARFGWDLSRLQITPQTDGGCVIVRPGWTPNRVLVGLESARNQILLVKSASRLVQWEPAWTWLDSFPGGFLENPSSTGNDFDAPG